MKKLILSVASFIGVFAFPSAIKAQFTDLYNFNAPTGSYPGSSLILSRNKFYGMTVLGGSLLQGVIFSIDTNGNGYTDMLNFNISNGRNPSGNLTISGNKFYGMTSLGGIHGD